MERSSSAPWVRALLELFRSQGLDPLALCAAAGVEPQRLQQPDGRISCDEVSRLWEAAIAASGNEALGVDRELAARYVNFDLVGYAMLSSADLRSGLEGFGRYLEVISSATTVHLELEGAHTWLVLGHTGYSRPLPWQRSAYSLLALLTMCRWVTRRDLQPLALHFGFAAPRECDRFVAAFGCMPQFDRPDHRMLLADCDLAASIPSRNPALLALHEHALQERVAALGDASTAYRVSTEIIRRLDRGEPRRQDVATSMGLADRTLQRRLHAEHTTFQQLLDEARRELARKYLADHRYALGQVAYMLGFADQSNLFRACKRWFGVPPAQLRERLSALE
jgi:AraC-like DNA-binding protein